MSTTGLDQAVKGSRTDKKRQYRKKLHTLVQKDLTIPQIAAITQTHPVTVWRNLKDMQASQALDIKWAINNRADVLTAHNMATLERLQMVVDSIDEVALSQLDPRQKGSLARDLSVVHGTGYDKERLERGQSTVNLSYRDATQSLEQIEAEIRALQGSQPIDGSENSE